MIRFFPGTGPLRRQGRPSVVSRLVGYRAARCGGHASRASWVQLRCAFCELLTRIGLGGRAARPAARVKAVRPSLVAHSVLLTIALVTITALAVGLVVFEEVGSQVQQRIDRRLADGATLFQASLEDSRNELETVGALLAGDQQLVEAIPGHRLDDLRERLNLTLGLRAIDDVLVADSQGTVLADARVTQVGNHTPPLASGVAGNIGFGRALAGQVVYGISRQEPDVLWQEVYLPVRDRSSGSIVGVIRLASFLDRRRLGQFRERTGLDVSLFSGSRRVVTTLVGPASALPADPDTFQRVVGQGQPVTAWRDLPTGRVRAYYAPLTGPDGTRVGMVSIAIPVQSVSAAWQRAVLPLAPVVLSIILAGAALGYVLARRVREPVLTLVGAARRLQDGDLSTPIPVIEEVELRVLAEELEMARCSVHERIETIAREETRQRALIDALSEPVLIATTDHIVVGANSAAIQLFGTRGSLSGQRIESILPFVQLAGDPREPQCWQGVLARNGRANDVQVCRTRLAAGSLPECDVFVIHDVSQFAALNRMREQLLYDVAHELRSPLAVLTGALELLATGYAEMSTREIDRLIASATRTAARLHRLMEDLLSAGSIQSGRFVVQPRPVALASVVDEAVHSVEDIVQQRRQTMTQLLPAAELVVMADRRYIGQVLTNLLTNASKYSPDGETIVISATCDGCVVTIAVDDHGPGIPAEQQAGLFERYYRVRAPHEKRGIGLGLAIARGIVEAHGGSIGVDSKAGAGTRVWFTLRLAPGQGEEADENPSG